MARKKQAEALSQLYEIVPAGAKIHPQSGEAAVIQDDLVHMHMMLAKVRQQWAQPLDIDETCKLAVVTVKLLETRRNMLHIPTKAAPLIKGSEGHFLPYDNE